MPNLITNKKAGRDYAILERFEVGVVLTGSEVKSLRAGKGVLTGSHVVVRSGEVYILGMQIPSYQPANDKNVLDPARTRKALLTKKEIYTLADYDSKKGYTIIPLSVFTKGKKIKMEIAVVRGKKKYDKRADLKKRDDQRYMQRHA